MSRNKIFTIGLVVSGIMDTFTVAVCRGVIKAAQEAGVKLIIFPGKYLDRDFSFRRDIMYEYQYNMVFSYAKKEKLDAVLVSANTIGCFTTVEKMQKMLSQYAGIPCVLIASKMDGYISVNFDNSSGIKEAMDYLIHGLKCTKIGMIGGPENNSDAYERKKAFQQALEQNGISLPEKRYIESDMSRYSLSTYRTFLKRNPDLEAVFCVNDDTAIGLYDVLKEYNITAGKQLLVLGYDNVLYATKMKPALSSVWADPVKLGETALEMAYKMLQGEKVESQELPTRFIRRDSLGKKMIEKEEDDRRRLDRRYINQYFEEIFYRGQNREGEREYEYLKEAFRELMEALAEIYEKQELTSDLKQKALHAGDVLIEHNSLDFADVERLVEHIEKIRKVMDDVNEDISAVIYRKIILAVEQRYGEMTEVQEENKYDLKVFVKNIMQFERGNDQAYVVLLEDLGWLNIKNAYIYMYEKPMIHLTKEEIVLPEKLYLKAVLKNGVAQSVFAVDQEIETSDVFTNLNIEKDNSPKVLLPLFANELLYGVLLCDMTEKLYEHGDFIVNQMSAAVKMIDLLKTNDLIQRQLEDSLATLKENNIALDTLSKVDVLTGILNRRGFFDSAEEFLQKNMEKGCDTWTVYVDMNNLKIVNDRYGHEEGDFSIKKIGELLVEMVGDKGIVGRIGGDEFALVISLEEACDIVQQIYIRFRSYNETSNKPYNITVSAGTSRIQADNPVKLNDALTHADEMLYEEKKNRVKSVAK